MPGRHAAPAGPSFYRDLLTMVGGILAVAVVVYLGLSALSTTDSSETTGTTVATGSGSTTSPPLPATARTTATSTTSTSTTSTPTSTSTTTTSTTIAIRAPSEIVVQVLNGVGVAGLAAEVSSDLEALGYQTLEPGNYTPALSQSRVWFAPGFEGEAFELAAEFPDALVERASADLAIDADIVVVLGASYES